MPTQLLRRWRPTFRQCPTSKRSRWQHETIARRNGCSKNSTPNKSASTSSTSGTKLPGQNRNTATGSGVAMGDYDGDGLVDVFLPRTTDGGRLFRNLGGFRFEDVDAISAGIGRARERVDARRVVRRYRQRRRSGSLRVRLPLPEPPLHQPRRRHVRRAGRSSSASISTAPAS